ncbi:HET-domain-containing protein, partial [Mytilinidion resinicola]
PSLLVCHDRWNSFFNTSDFLRVCTAKEEEIDFDRDIVHCQKTVRHINKSASEGCNWCKCIQRAFMLHNATNEGFLDPDEGCTISLSRDYLYEPTPTGHNSYLLSLRHRNLASDSTNCHLFAFTNHNNIAASLVTAQPRQTILDTPAAVQEMRTWLADCRLHDCCPLKNDVVLPTRVIEVSPAASPDNPRILVANGSQGQYAALSYCWGERPYGHLQNSNLEEYTRRLDLLALPQTLREAIKVAKDLGILYLWIDALCILQDSDADKQHELATMQRVYRNALITIVVASSDDVTNGFLQPRPQLYTAYTYTIPFRVGTNLFGTVSFSTMKEIAHEESLEPINRRCWTLQEQILSTRSLYFASHTLQWRCSQGERNLSDSLHVTRWRNSIQDMKYGVSYLYQSNFECWAKTVADYSHRSMVLSSDKLNAIAAIAQDFAPMLGPHYYAGIWEKSLLSQLLWFCDGNAPRASPYRAPSWSWASRDDGVYMITALELAEHDTEICSIVRVSTQLKENKLPFGEVISASIELRGGLRRARLDGTPHEFIPEKKKPRLVWVDKGEGVFEGQGTFLTTHGIHLDNFGLELPIEVLGMPLVANRDGIGSGLLLVPTAEYSYERVGTFYQTKLASLHQVHEVEITIV